MLLGRLTQRGDDLSLSLELVDARTGNHVWGEQYTRKLNELVAVQSEIARDVGVNEILANRLKIGPAADCPECKFEESIATARPRKLLPLASRGLSRQTADHSPTSDHPTSAVRTTALSVRSITA